MRRINLGPTSDGKERPKYAFGHYIGPAFKWFAWYPVRLWYGRMVWLRYVSKRRVIKNEGLDGPVWGFWSYDDVD